MDLNPGVFKQKIILWICAGVLSILLLILLLWMFSDSAHHASPSRPLSYKAPIASSLSRIDPKEVWVERISNDMDLTNKRVEQIGRIIDNIMTMSAQNTDKSASETLPQGVRSDIQSAMKNSSHDEGKVEGDKPDGVQDFIERNPQGGISKPTPLPTTLRVRTHTKGIQRTSLSLLNNKSSKALKTNDNTIPAGALAQVVLLGGVDASTSIQASNDPRPILLRVTNPGTLPRKFKSDLHGCHVLAAAYGDISSERVFMRLEKLTCMERRTGEVVEMNVSGYVAGEDGRAGLRGTLVDRAGASMRNAAVGGFISGIGNFLAQSSTNPMTFSLNSGLSQVNPMTGSDLLKHGAVKGASNALEKYADFYIKRAEQMQPIIQVQAGRVADIVFTQGVSMEDSASRNRLVQIKDRQRHAEIHRDNEESKPIGSWLQDTSHDDSRSSHQGDAG